MPAAGFNRFGTAMRRTFEFQESVAVNGYALDFDGLSHPPRVRGRSALVHFFAPTKVHQIEPDTREI